MEEKGVQPMTCPKHTRAKPCGGAVETVVCGYDGFCAATAVRCEKHGGWAGARRSLAAHRGLWHPRVTKET